MLDQVGRSLGLSLVSLAALSGEDIEIVSVVSKSLYIGLEGFLRVVDSSVVHGNTDGLSELFLDAGSLQLLQREASSKLSSGIVSLGLASDHRSEESIGSGAHLSGSHSSSNLSNLLLGGLVKVKLNSLLPVFLEVGIRDSVVVFDHIGLESKLKEVFYGKQCF